MSDKATTENMIEKLTPDEPGAGGFQRGGNGVVLAGRRLDMTGVENKKHMTTYAGAIGIFLAVCIIMLFLAKPVFSSVSEFDDYVEANLCSVKGELPCLEVLRFKACRNGCYRKGYNMRAATPGRIEIHLTLNNYLKLLTNAVVTSPTTVSDFSLGLTLEDLLWNQLQMFFVATFPGTNKQQARFYAADFSELPIDSVKSHNVVDPTKFYAVTWVNEGGMAHAMTQADLGLWLIRLAQAWTYVDQPSRVDDYLRLSERVFRPYGIRVADGGVRNNKRGNRCFDNKYCYWFHSQEAQTTSFPWTILNKNLHAIRDVLKAYEALATWRDKGHNGYALPSEFNTRHIEQLKEWGRGGLFQLAYAAGNKADWTAPPNLQEFLMPDPSTWIFPFPKGNYYAGYHYIFGGGPRGIKPWNTCHYHYHTAEVLADILILINPEPNNVIPGRKLGSEYFINDPYFVGVYYKLLYNRSDGDTRSCNNRPYIPKSKKNMNDVPTAEIYMGADKLLGPNSFQAWCEDHQPWKFRLRFAPYGAAKNFYYRAYRDCLF